MRRCPDDSWHFRMTSELDIDSVDLLDAFDAFGVEYLIVGAHALAAHGVIRATGDVDILVKPTIENARRVFEALVTFGAPVQAHGVTAEYFSTPERVYQLGLPPRRIDLLTSISGVGSDEAFATAVEWTIGGSQRKILSAKALIQNKRATGRIKDLADVERLERLLASSAGP